MSTLNYWLGKLNKLQLFGHGNKPLYFKVAGSPDVREIKAIVEDEHRVTIIIE